MIAALQENQTGETPAQVVEPIQMQKGKLALLIAPYYDMATSITSIAERTLIELLQSEGMTVLTLEGPEATYDNLVQVLKPGYIELVVYLGHGLDDAWIGQQPSPRPLLTADEAGLLSGSIVVAIACNSLKYLGNLAVTKKAKAYLGFLDLVLCPVTDLSMADRNYAADFVRTFIHPVVALIQGRSVSQAVLEFQDLCYYYADLYATKRYDFWEFHSFAMMHNAENFSYAGHPDTVL